MPKTIDSNKKGFKNSPLGEIPKSWEVRPAFDVCQAVIDCKNRTPPVMDSGYPVVRTMNVRDGRFVRQNLAYTDVRSYEIWTRRGKPRPGDILITREAPVGEACLIPEDMPEVCLGQRMMMYQVDPSVMNNRFMVLSLLSEAVQSRLADLAGGSTVGHVRVDDIRQLFVHVPPISEQGRIADIINTIDSTITQTSTLIAKLKQMKAGLLHDLLTRGLDENGELRNAIDRPEQFKDSPLGQIPKDWEVCELSDLVDPARPVCYGILMPGYGYPNGVPVIKVKDIINSEIETNDLLLTSPEIDNQYYRSRLRYGDLLFTIRGTVGRMAFVPEILEGANITQDTARLAIVGAEPRYIRQYLQMPLPQAFIELHTIGQAVKGINLRDVRRIPIALPPRVEQLQIIGLCDVYDTRIRSEEACLNKLKEQKKGLMHDLLTGRVRVTDLKEILA